MTKVFVVVVNRACGCGKLRCETAMSENEMRVFESREDAEAFLASLEDEQELGWDDFSAVWEFDVTPAKTTDDN